MRNWQKGNKKPVGIFSLFFIVAIITCYAMHGHGILYSTGIDRTCFFLSVSLALLKIITITYTNKSKLVKSVDLPPLHTVIIIAWLDLTMTQKILFRSQTKKSSLLLWSALLLQLPYYYTNQVTQKLTFIACERERSGFYIFMFLFFRCHRAAHCLAMNRNIQNMLNLVGFFFLCNNMMLCCNVRILCWNS